MMSFFVHVQLKCELTPSPKCLNICSKTANVVDSSADSRLTSRSNSQRLRTTTTASLHKSLHAKARQKNGYFSKNVKTFELLICVFFF